MLHWLGKEWKGCLERKTHKKDSFQVSERGISDFFLAAHESYTVNVWFEITAGPPMRAQLAHAKPLYNSMSEIAAHNEWLAPSKRSACRCTRAAFFVKDCLSSCKVWSNFLEGQLPLSEIVTVDTNVVTNCHKGRALRRHFPGLVQDVALYHG